jgi:hypothetical protein
LAVAQLSAKDEAGYRGTCRELLRQTGPQADAALAVFLCGHMPQDVGGLALSGRLMAGPSPVGASRFTAAQVCVMKPEGADVLEQVLAQAQWAHPVYRGAALCRLKRYAEAADVLKPLQQRFPLARLYLALVEVGQGNREQARKALDAAVQADRSKWPWESQQEFELLRREVEELLVPPRMETVP